MIMRGRPPLSIREFVRREFAKQYAGASYSELEKALCSEGYAIDRTTLQRYLDPNAGRSIDLASARVDQLLRFLWVHVYPGPFEPTPEDHEIDPDACWSTEDAERWAKDRPTIRDLLRVCINRGREEGRYSTMGELAAQLSHNPKRYKISRPALVQFWASEKRGGDLTSKHIDQLFWYFGVTLCPVDAWA